MRHFDRVMATVVNNRRKTKIFSFEKTPSLPMNIVVSEALHSPSKSSKVANQGREDEDDSSTFTAINVIKRNGRVGVCARNAK